MQVHIFRVEKRTFEFTATLSGTNLPQKEEVEWIACKMVKLISDR